MKKIGIVLAVLSLLALLSRAIERRNFNHEKSRDHFERILHRKEQKLAAYMERLMDESAERPLTGVLDEASPELQKLSREQGISFFYYEGDSLVYWTDHSIPVGKYWNRRMDRAFLSFRNTDYININRKLAEGRLMGLIQIRTHYPVQNKYLMNAFHPDFRMDKRVEIRILEDEGCLPVMSSWGDYLFSLDFSGVDLLQQGRQRFIILLVLLCTVLLFYALKLFVSRSKVQYRHLSLILVSIVLPVFSYVFLEYLRPAVFVKGELFQPDLFASRFLPSLGHLGIITLVTLYLVLIWASYGKLPDKDRPRQGRILGVVLLVLATGLFLLCEQLIKTLVLDSGISFETNRITSISVYSFAGLLIILSGFVSIALIFDRAIRCFGPGWKRSWLTGALIISLVNIPLMLLPGECCDLPGWIALIIFLGTLHYLQQKQEGRVRFSRFILAVLFVSVFLVLRLQEYNQVKLERQREVTMVKLSSEHDPVAEMLFSELSMAIRNDSVLGTFMDHPYVDIDPLVNHLRRNYFSGYWTKYDLLITVCRPPDSLYMLSPEEEARHCYSFFGEMIQAEGIQIPSSDFYFMENLNGRISYLGALPYFQKGSEHRVFIELDSRIRSEELGYPELLLDEGYEAFTGLGLSTARFHKGVLVTQEGDFPYRRTVDFYTSGEQRFEKIRLHGYDHNIYNVDEDNTIIVGSPAVSILDYLISLSYLFAINFLLVALFYLLINAKSRSGGLNWNFKNRIQYAMVGILFLTFALIASGTIYFVVQQYRNKNNDNLRNTMRSVHIELIHKVEYEEDLRNWSSDAYYNLDELLQKFSNVFYSDINLFDEYGELLATSRPEIFDRQLQSRRMHREVFESLSGGQASEYIHNEHIGRLNYISAYVPLVNNENEFLAYLNLPYFTQSEALTRDVTNVVVAIVNIYLILLLFILGASVFLADRITQPLRMIQNRIARVSLGGKNEMISYERSDEIKGLVEEYNFMVQELGRSAELLAQSERESAWREMAKQIAHEIKNPLTPMKLNVQHLQRTMAEGKADPAQVDRMAATLIEQIDSLSAIANEFSDFAKMPRAKRSRVNLVRKLEDLVQLYDTDKRAGITLDFGGQRRVYVFADKEQLMRVFINLVKNSLQSIPEQRKGRIDISLELAGERALVAVRDNGKGIPDEIRDKLFRPNFTTKSSGMGMGLAISSNIIRSLGGEIWFESEPGEGTTFFISLPLMVEK